MLSRTTLRGSASAFACARCSLRRGYAAAAVATSNFDTNLVSGTRLAVRDVPGPASTLALVAKAGTRYEWVPGLAEGLEKFAFRNTKSRFSIRIVRETELLGSEFFSRKTRETVSYGAKFMQEDLPYFVELLAEVAYQTKYQHHVLHEIIQPAVAEAHNKFLSDPSAIALNAVHGLAYHRGLGTPLYPSSNVSPMPGLTPEEIEAYAAAAYSKPNFSLVGSGIQMSQLEKWSEEFFNDVPEVPPHLPTIQSPPTKYFGGEERIAHSKGNTIVIAFPGTGLTGGTAAKPEMEVLASILGGTPSVKWSAGSSLLSEVAAAAPGLRINTELAKYSDAGLLYVTISGNAKAVGAAAKQVASAVKSLADGQIPKEALTKAIAQVKFKTYDAESGQAPALDIIGLAAIGGKVQSSEEALKAITSITENAIKQAAQKLLSGKASVAAVGDLQQLPYAEELGLSV